MRWGEPPFPNQSPLGLGGAAPPAHRCCWPPSALPVGLQGPSPPMPFLHNLHGALGRLLALLGPGDRAAKGCSREQLLVLHAWPSPSASLSRLRPPLGRLLCLFAPSSLLGQRFGVPRQHRADSHTAPNAGTQPRLPAGGPGQGLGQVSSPRGRIHPAGAAEAAPEAPPRGQQKCFQATPQGWRMEEHEKQPARGANPALPVPWGRVR